ncbi:MAG: hypothetical protein JWP81_1704 [Ferruginibacter sp.]|nr:hypothetical protein [Ferruginibacter sp.]
MQWWIYTGLWVVDNNIQIKNDDNGNKFNC